MESVGPIGRLFVMQVARQVDALAHQEQQGHAQAAEYLEVDPDALKGKGHKQVGAPGNQEEGDPGQVQVAPHRRRQADGMAHHALDQQLVTDPVATGKTQGKQPVNHRSFPFQEGFAVEGQGHAAEQQAGCQGQPLAFLQALLHGEQAAVDHHRTGDQYAGGAENAAQFNALAGEFDGAGVQLENDEKQQKRDEIDELFHGSSQDEDVTA